MKTSSNALVSTARFTVRTGFTFAMCYELDEILVQECKEPYFVPGMRKFIASTGLEEQAKSLKKLVLKIDIILKHLIHLLTLLLKKIKKLFKLILTRKV